MAVILPLFVCLGVSVPHGPVYSCDLGVLCLLVKCFSSRCCHWHTVFSYADKTVILVFLFGHLCVCLHVCVSYSFI